MCVPAPPGVFLPVSRLPPVSFYPDARDKVKRWGAGHVPVHTNFTGRFASALMFSVSPLTERVAATLKRHAEERCHFDERHAKELHELTHFGMSADDCEAIQPAIPSLVQLLQLGGGASVAVLTLVNLSCTSDTSRDAIREAGAIPLLVALLHAGAESKAAENAAGALKNLAAYNPTNKDAVRESKSRVEDAILAAVANAAAPLHAFSSLQRKLRSVATARLQRAEAGETADALEAALAMAAAVGAADEAVTERVRSRLDEVQTAAARRARRESVGLNVPLPADFTCPITYDKMKDPVVASDGHSYERSSIEEILRGPHPLSPLTRAALGPTHPRARVPLEWNPTWTHDTLTEEGIIEAWQLYLQTAKIRTRASATGSGAVDALADNYRMPDDPEGADAPIWERKGRTYGRRLARLGGTLRRHFLADNGGWRSEKELGEYLGRGGRIVGGRRIGAKLTTAEAHEYRTLLQQLQPDEHEWAMAQRPGARERPADVHAVEVICAGDGAGDGPEYLIEYSDGSTRWGRRPRAMAPGLTKELRAARERFLEEGERTIEQHVEDALGGTRGAWWLATKAPMAVGARPVGEILAEAAQEMGDEFLPSSVAERTAERMGPGHSAAQGARVAATEARAVAERSDETSADERATPSERASLAEKAEAAWAWAAALDAYAASLEAPTPEGEGRQRTAARAYAEWVTASARAATGASAEAVLAWAKALPEHRAAATENAEGAYAATAADARSPAKRFRPGARPECFLGTLGPADRDGHRHKRSSLELTEAQRRAAATLPQSMPIPTEADMGQDPRVAWSDAWHMWSEAPCRLGWKLTSAQLEQLERQRDAALIRRAAKRSTRHDGDVRTISGPRAEETPPTEHEPGVPAHGINRSRQQMAEAMAAEERADEEANEALEDGWEPEDWSAEEIEAAERDAAAMGAEEGTDEARWDAAADEEYEVLQGAAEAYLLEDAACAEGPTGHEQTEEMTSELRRRAAEQHVLALERKQRREAEESRRSADALAEAATAAEREWQNKKAEAVAARHVADARMLAHYDARRQDWGTNYRDSRARAAESAAAEQRAIQARVAERAARDAHASQAHGTARLLLAARAELARSKIRDNAAADITEEERVALDSDEQERDTQRRTAQQREAAQAALDDAARAARTRAAEAANRLRVAREATTEALRALDGSDERARRKARMQEERAGEEERYARVEYWDTLTAEQRVAILTSPTLRLCVRHREMERREPVRETDSGIAVGMEPKERRNIDTEATKRAAAVGLAIERRYDIQYAYAVDGSKDDAEAWGANATGERAAAWGAWDGTTACGGALPPGTGNQEAELFAIERILARHTRGDRILLMCDCQAALETIEASWQSGRAGVGGPASGRTGGLLIEAIVRHRLRITSRKGDDEHRGCVCFMWVKAHGGGVAPNAYADAIAKSCLTADVDYATLDTPYLALPRACLYMAQPEPRENTWELGHQRFSCITADRSLRRLIIDGITRHVIAHLPRLSHTRCDVRMVAAVTHTRGRPVGATPGAEPKHGITEPTETGRAMRLRSNDLRQRDDECPLCKERGPHEGDHIMRCAGIPQAHRDAAMTRVTTALEAAANTLPSGDLQVPTASTQQAWRDAALRAGQHGAVAALGTAPIDEDLHAPSSAREWTRGGWRTRNDEYELDLHSEGARSDRELAVWCAVAVRSAHAAAIRAANAENAAAEVEHACGEATRQLEDGPLGSANRAAGDAAVDEATGAPRITPREDGGGIGAIRLRFAPLQPHTLAHIREWEGRRSWLPAARAGIGARTWSAHTHRGFRPEGGAAGRKAEQAVAVDAHGAVYNIAAPAKWPWMIEYEMDGYEATRPDGSEGARTRTTIRLGHADGAITARVSARHVQANGQRFRGGDKAMSAEVELQGDADGRGLRALFWNIAMGHRTTAQSAQTTLRRAAAAAASRCQGDADSEGWHTLRRAMGGEIPPPTSRERMEAQQHKRALSDAAATEAETRTRAAFHDAQREQATAPAPKRASNGAERLRGAAETLGVNVDVTRQELRRAFLRKALDAHPDKGGNAADFTKLQGAYRDMDSATDDTRRHAAQEIRDARDVMKRARRDATHNTGRAEEGLTEAVARARAEAERRAAAEWEPGWKTTAQHLRAAGGAFMQLWTRYQKGVTRHLNALARDVPGENYATHGERQAAAAAVRRAARRHAKDAARQQAVATMRQAEQRATHERRAAAEAAADQLRRRGASALFEAAQIDGNVLIQEYRAKVPWTIWTQDEGSTRYELYEIAEVDSKWITLMRAGASAADRRRPLKKAGWDRFEVNWDCFTGILRYGPERRGIEIVHKDATAGTSEEDEGTDEEEHQLRALEIRRATRHAAQLIEDARTADRDAARMLQDCPQRADTAADDAMQHEEAEGMDDIPTDSSDAEPRDTAPDAEPGMVRDTEAQGAQHTRARGAWKGKNWFREAWTGPVAATEYSTAWRDGPPARPPRSAAANAAQRAAQQASLDANNEGNRRAATAAIRETARRSGRLWGAKADAEAIEDQRRATAQLTQAIRQWQVRERIGRQANDGTKTAHAAAEAANALQRKRPAVDTVEAAARKRAMIDAAHTVVATGAHLEHTSGSREEQARQVLSRAEGSSTPSTEGPGRREAVLLMATVLESLQGAQDVTGGPLRGAPRAAGVRNLHEDAAHTTAAAADTGTRGDGQQHPPNLAIHVGNLRTKGEAARRPRGAEDRRVDRTTAYGNPFLVNPTNDRERDAACAAYDELIGGDTMGANVRDIATRHGLEVDPRFEGQKATNARNDALQRLERDVLTLRPGQCIRLLCHCAPKRCHAHVIAREIQRRLRARGVHILVDNGGWEESEAHGDDGTNADETNGGADASSDDEAVRATERRAEQGAPDEEALTEWTGAPPALPGRGANRLIEKLQERHNRLRNKRAYEAFAREIDDLICAHPNPKHARTSPPHPLDAAQQNTGTNSAAEPPRGSEPATRQGSKMHEGGVDMTDPGNNGDTGENASGTNGATAGIDRSNGMGVADETPAHDAESAQRREVEVPVESVMCVGDGGGETSQGHEGAHDAESRGGIDDGEQRARRGAQGAEDDEGDEAMEGNEGDKKKKRPPRKRAKGTGSQQQRQDRKRPGWAREA